MAQTPPTPALAYPGVTPEPQQPPLALSRQGGTGIDGVLRWLTRSAALLILFMLAALIAVLTHTSVPAFQKYGARFVTSSDWKPNTTFVTQRDAQGKIVRDADDEPIKIEVPPSFGALAVIYGTAVSSVIALVIAVPLSFGAAIFLVRVAPRLLIPPVSFLIEFLAAIPSIAYGVWGLLVMTPFLQGKTPVWDWLGSVAHWPVIGWASRVFLIVPDGAQQPVLFRGLEGIIKFVLGDVPGFGWLFWQKMTDNAGKPMRDAAGHAMYREVPMVGRDMFAGGLILAIMILPIITAISRDVLRTVPPQQIEGSIALGATWWQSVREMLKYSRSALYGGVMLGLARAAGETMAITMVIGNAMRISASPFAAAQTMSSLLANEFKEANDDLHRSALTAVALILLAMSLLFNVVARYLVVGKSSRSAAAH